MGRYYEGDIEGKFWFACQSSDDGEFFGAKESNPQFTEYYINTSDLDLVLHGIRECKVNLGDNVRLFHKAYRGGLDEEPLWRTYSKEKQTQLYEWFARLDMGMRILAYMLENPGEDCNFTAEF